MLSMLPGGGGGGGAAVMEEGSKDQQASCLAVKQAVEFPHAGTYTG